MRSEFDTLEQYQESMKEFNENTRMGFEEFIQSHGSDRNKLQLRCTPYTSKKGGYGSFDLDFGLCVYQHQQSKVDELQKQNAWLSGVANRENKRANKLQEENVSTTVLLGKTIQEKNELQKRVDAVKGLAQTLWEKSEEKHQQGKVWESKTLGECADEILDVLEQALKGGVK